MREALTDSLHEIMGAHEDAIMLGEALDTRGGASQLTYGFLAKYGAKRVIETPISENALVGMALGSAIAGLRVIAEVYSADFIFCAGSEVINDIAKWRYQHQWDKPLRLVLRMPAGSARNWSGPEHTQAIEGILQNVPGLRIVIPGTADDAARALKESVEIGDPVIFLEHRALYDVKRPISAVDDDDASSILTGRVAKPGSDITLVAWGAMRSTTLEAAESLEVQGISAEVVDPITIKPMNFDLIAESLEKTGRLLVVDEGPRTGSISAEIMARTLEATRLSSGNIRRITLPDIHHPFEPSLEAQVIPSSAEVCTAVMRMLRSPEAAS